MPWAPVPWNPLYPVVTRDYGWAQVYAAGCWGGPARGVGAAPCRWLDLDGNRAVDLLDFARWARTLRAGDP